MMRVVVIEGKVTRDDLFAPSHGRRLNLVTFLEAFDFSNRQGLLSKGFKARASAHQSILALSLNSNTALIDLDLLIVELSSG